MTLHNPFHPVWVSPAFDAANFTGNGSMTWTVASGDVTTFAYSIVGKLMFVSVQILTTTVGGTPNTQLQITIPAGKTATKTMRNLCHVIDNGTNQTGVLAVTAGATVITVRAAVNNPNWAASTDNTGVLGQIVFEID